MYQIVFLLNLVCEIEGEPLIHWFQPHAANWEPCLGYGKEWRFQSYVLEDVVIVVRVILEVYNYIKFNWEKWLKNKWKDYMVNKGKS